MSSVASKPQESFSEKSCAHISFLVRAVRFLAFTKLLLIVSVLDINLAASTMTLPAWILDNLPRESWCSNALEHARRNLSEPIFNHSFRVYMIAKWLSQVEGGSLTQHDQLPLIFAASIFHDMGACDLYNGAQRFEVEGADAAKNRLLSEGISEADSHKVWVAIAIHTSPGIAEKIDPLARLIRLAVRIDFSTADKETYGAVQVCADIEKQLPRLNIEEVLARTVVQQAKKIPERVDGMTWPSSEKHPSASWPGILLRAHCENPDLEGINPAF